MKDIKSVEVRRYDNLSSAWCYIEYTPEKELRFGVENVTDKDAKYILQALDEIRSQIAKFVSPESKSSNVIKLQFKRQLSK